MAIYRVGERFRKHKLLKRRGGKRDVTATLSLTAMVDMFTVLVIFLLQSYNTTGRVIFLPKEVSLPKAQTIKPLNPSVVVTISEKEILVDKLSVATYAEVKAQPQALIPSLHKEVIDALARAKVEFESSLQNRIKTLVRADQNEPMATEEEEKNTWKQVTVQADKSMDFQTVRKVLFTVTEAGAGQINFAVLKQSDPSGQ
jgi:biopolymer transport protein ExbD